MVDSCEDNRRKNISLPVITNQNFNESSDELNKLDIFVCGICYNVSHYLDDFIAHREIPCERIAVIQPNTTDQKPQVWSFLLWKNAKHRSNLIIENSTSSWQLYQEWCQLPESVKDAWIQAGSFLKGVAGIRSQTRRIGVNEPIIYNDDDILMGTKGLPPPSAVANCNKILKKVRSGKFLEFVVEKILAKRQTNKKTEYWIKFKGRPTVDEKFWEPADVLMFTCQDLIQAFENKNQVGSDFGRKRTISQANDTGLLTLANRNKQKTSFYGDDSGQFNSGEEDSLRKRVKNNVIEDYETFFLRRTGGIIKRIDMKSCTNKIPSKEPAIKKINLAAEIGLESEDEEEDGGKENIFGRKNVPAVLKPNDNKVLVVNSQGVVALDPVEIPNLSSGIYIMTNRNENNTKTSPEVKSKEEKKDPIQMGGFVILDENEKSIKYTSNEILGQISDRYVEPLPELKTSILPPKIPQLTSFKSGALTITPSIRNISKDTSATGFTKRTYQTQNHTPQKILGPKNARGISTEVAITPKTKQTVYTPRGQHSQQITYINTNGELINNKKVLGSVNRYKVNKQQQQQIYQNAEIQYTTSPMTKTIIRQDETPNLIIPTSGYQIDTTPGVTDTVMIKVEMSPGGTSQYVRGLSGYDTTPQYTTVNTALQNNVSGLKVKRITSPRKRNTSVRDSAHISILNRKDVTSGSSLAVPARKLKIFNKEEEEVEEQAVATTISTTGDQEEMVTIAGEDGTLYQVASSELNGSAIMITNEDGQQQCLYVTDENGQPTIIQTGHGEQETMLLDQAVYNEATGQIQMFSDQTGVETQVFQQDENGQLLPVENPDEILAQVHAQQQLEQQELAAAQAQQEFEVAEQQQQQQQEFDVAQEQSFDVDVSQDQQQGLAELGQENHQDIRDQQMQHEDETALLQQNSETPMDNPMTESQPEQQEQDPLLQDGDLIHHDPNTITAEQQELLQQQMEGLAQQQMEGVALVEGGEQTDSSEVVAQLVEASEPSSEGGPRQVVLLLSDGNLIQTEMTEEQFAALEYS